MKKYLLSFFILCSLATKAQKVENIYVNLYTDSLRKGTFNYINIDGKMSDGKFLPLDSNHLIFSASAGKFTGNNLWIDSDFTPEKVTIKVTSRNNPSLLKEFTMYVKQMPDPALKSMDEVMPKVKRGKG